MPQRPDFIAPNGEVGALPLVEVTATQHWLRQFLYRPEKTDWFDVCHNAVVANDSFEQQQQQVQVQIAWPDGLADQAQLCNQFMFAFDGSESNGQSAAGMYFLVGHVAPPLWATSPEAVAEHIENFGSTVPVQPRGSFFMSRGKAIELWEQLGKHLGVA